MSRELLRERYEKEFEKLPDFVQKYLLYLEAIPRSTNTLYEYSKEYRRFLTWLLAEGIVQAKDITEIRLADFERLNKDKIVLYKSFLNQSPKRTFEEKNENDLVQASLGERNTHRLKVTVQRSITALRSLFKYLANEEVEEYDEQIGDYIIRPMLRRNIMVNIENGGVDASGEVRKDKIEKMLYLDSEAIDFVEYVYSGYGNTLTSRQAKTAYEKNRIRDTAILALFLGSGIRLSELVNTNVSDLNYEGLYVQVQRKGDALDHAMISPIFIDYLQEYIEQRESLYNADDSVPALFLTKHKNVAKRMEGGSIEKMIDKYSTAFGKRTTPHKLRHSVGTMAFRKTKNLKTVSEILGQRGTSATEIYTHIVKKEKRSVINDLWT
ncbi:tyrosine recombinase XerS [Enterococcus devriesei]|uniref:tyrosine recombinase XerS n=1 Tax=Enterococcus devriesei TaxID=319970 RepID=UPI001C12402C|nr:tyrosine recombinase XerS [Enterococcus devriesei]MBU5365739.1 tyrosine recombinase XerS [Enterococcus devriesei]MDT2821889.1 tyrosine recombinase XerS [Enterococcus devriesei]